MRDPHLCKGMKFASTVIFRIEMKEWDFKREYSYIFIISKNMCGFRIYAYYRARRRAKKKLEGEVKLQHKRLYDYTTTIRATDPGSCITIKCEVIEKQIYLSQIFGKEDDNDNDISKGSLRNLILSFL